MSADHYTYRVTWSQEDAVYLGLCVEFSSLSWLAPTPEEALSGIRNAAAEAVADMRSNNEPVPAVSPSPDIAVHKAKPVPALPQH